MDNDCSMRKYFNLHQQFVLFTVCLYCFPIVSSCNSSSSSSYPNLNTNHHHSIHTCCDTSASEITSNHPSANKIHLVRQSQAKANSDTTSTSTKPNINMSKSTLTSIDNSSMSKLETNTPKKEEIGIDNDASVKSLLWKEAQYKIPMAISTTENEHSNKNSNTIPTLKRSSYLPWTPYFLAIAKLTSQRSKDPQTQTGACIVDSENRIVGVGYNGFPRGCSDDILPWSSLSPDHDNDMNIANPLHHKKWFMVHAEINAILNKIGNVNNTTMYVYGSFPNNECAKIIIQAGIKEIVYIDNSNNDNNDENCNPNEKDEIELSTKAARILFGLAGVKLTKYNDFEHSTERIPDLTFTTSADTSKNMDTNATDDIDDNCDSSDIDRNTDTALLESHKNLLIREANYDPNVYKRSKNDNKRSNEHQHHLKRSDYLSWDDYFMSVASLSAYRSKDPNTQVGACIVDSNKCIIGIGYNGFPRGCSDDHLPWSRRASNPLHMKYMYVVHAEVNAILNKGSKDCTGATLYVDLFPCNDCAKVIIQSGIKEIVYLRDTYHNTDGSRASRIMFEMAGVKFRQYFPKRRSINVDIFDRE